jgi:uncharacterized pyridoxamine 5'-phosphate oxidase family protein
MGTAYLETTKNVYKAAVEKPDVGLCCHNKYHVLMLNQPLAVCAKNTAALAALNREDISGSNRFYDAGGCC